MKKLWKVLPVAAVAATSLWSAVASAAPVVGVSSSGNGVYDVYADVFDMQVDTALAQGFNPNATVTDPAQGYNTVLTAQAVVGSLLLNSQNVSPVGLNRFPPVAGFQSFELTKVLKIDERVVNQQGFTASFGMTTQTFDLDANTAGNQQLLIYYDQLGAGDDSRAYAGVDGPGNPLNANAVRCYGTGTATSGAGNGCAADGRIALSASLINLSSSFSADATGQAIGTGSFRLTFQIDYVDPTVLDVQTGSIFYDELTGSIGFPSFYDPTRVFDGTLTSSGIALRVESSENFFPAAVPEPASLALMGLALFGAGTISRRRRS